MIFLNGMKILKKLILPILSVIAFTSIGVGTTFALFTSKDESNIAIQAGKVNVSATIDNLNLYSPTLVALDGTIMDDTNAASTTNFYNGGTASISDGVLYLDNITPGDKVSFKINIKNNSNVEIKYRAIYSDITTYTGTETYKLIDVLKVKLDDETISTASVIKDWTKTSLDNIDPLNVSVELPTTTEKEYSSLKCSIRFEVEAVQGNAYTESNISKVKINVPSEDFTITATDFNVNKNTMLEFLLSSLTSSTMEITVKYNDTVYSVITFVFNGNDETVTGTDDSNEVFSFHTKNSIEGESSTYQISKDTTIDVNAEFCCVLEGTPITLSDYSFKNVEDLVPGDKILAYDFFKGEFTESEINYTFDECSMAETFKVSFDNGTSISIANNEDMFDVNARQFFTINYGSYKDLIGKEVLINNLGSNDTSKITSIEYKHQKAHYYTLYSKGYMNYVANNVLMLYSVSGFNEKYTITKDLKIDMDIYNADVEKYGLFTYEDFPELTKEMFDDFDMKTVTFLLGKGYLTKESLNQYNEAFIKEYNSKKPLFLEK